MRKMFVLKNLIHRKVSLGLFLKYMQHESMDIEDFVVSLTRGFVADQDFLLKFRVKPNAALLKNLVYRLGKYSKEQHIQKIQPHMTVNNEMTKAGIFVPGCFHGSERSNWLQPIVVSNKA
jgi:hypothetical protein